MIECARKRAKKYMALGIGKLKSLFASNAPDGVGVVGIDMGSSSIKVVQLREVKGKATLETYGELQLGPYGDREIGQATKLEVDRLTEAVTDIIREASVSSKQAALAIPYGSSFVTVISLPPVSREQLASMVPIEARKYVPVPINEVTLDWFVIPSGDEKDKNQSNKHKVLLAAIHNDALSRSRSVLRNAMLTSRFSEIEIFGTIRSSVLREDGNVAILDFGAATSKLYVVENGIVMRSHSVTSGAQDLTRLIVEKTGLTQREAEELKRVQGLSDVKGDTRVIDAVTPGLDRIMREARLILERYEESTGATIEKVILTGGGSALKGLDAFAAASLEKEVVRANPFEKVEYPAFLEETLAEVGPSFSVAIGVALRLLHE